MGCWVVGIVGTGVVAATRGSWNHCVPSQLVNFFGEQVIVRFLFSGLNVHLPFDSLG